MSMLKIVEDHLDQGLLAHVRSSKRKRDREMTSNLERNKLFLNKPDISLNNKNSSK